MRVEIKVKAKDKGQIVIGFESNDDFERILDVLEEVESVAPTSTGSSDLTTAG